MSQRIRFNTAQDLFEAFPPAANEISAEPSDAPSLDYVRMLAASDTPEDAITFLAYLLPRREAVWWGHQCLTHVSALLDEQDGPFLELAEEWVREPEEEQRMLALMAADTAETMSPGVWIAFGAAWSGGSMVLGQNAPPPPELTPQAINTGILAALARGERATRAETLRNFIGMGLQLLDQA